MRDVHPQESSTGVGRALPGCNQHADHPHCPQPGDNSVDTRFYAVPARCGCGVDNPCMTCLPLGVTPRTPKLPCGRPRTIHRETQLSTAAVHAPSTGPWSAPPATTGFFHRIHRPYDNDETKEDGSSPEYLGIPSSSSTSPEPPPEELRARCWPTVSVALGSVRTSCHSQLLCRCYYSCLSKGGSHR
jgi:hypothetical protein